MHGHARGKNLFNCSKLKRTALEARPVGAVFIQRLAASVFEVIMYFLSVLETSLTNDVDFYIKSRGRSKRKKSRRGKVMFI